MNDIDRDVGEDQFNKYWSQFDGLKIDFAHLTEIGTLDGGLSVETSTNMNRTQTELRHWNSSIGLDMTMLEIEDLFVNLVNDVNKRVIGLVQRTMDFWKTNSNDQPEPEHIEILKKSSLSQWQWFKSLSQVIEKHVENASEYHLFHHTLLQYQLSIRKLGCPVKSRNCIDKATNDSFEANFILHTIKTHISEYLTWWQKIEVLVDQSQKLSPIGLRGNYLFRQRPCTMLLEYTTNMIVLKKEDQILLTQDTSGQCYIENEKQDRIDGMPSICYELSPPDIDTIECVLLLRSQLLTNWTVAIKNLGSMLVQFVATVLGQWINIDVKSFNSPNDRRDNIYGSLQTIGSLINQYLKNSSELLLVQSKINAMRTELEIKDDSEIDDVDQITTNTIFIDVSPRLLERQLDLKPDLSNSKYKKLILQKRTIEILVNLYLEFHRYWDNYRVLIDDPSLSSHNDNSRNSLHKFNELVSQSSDRLRHYLSTRNDVTKTKYTNSGLGTDCNGNHWQESTIDLTSRRRSQGNGSRLNVKAEKRISVMECSSHPQPIGSSSMDINDYFTGSLLPKTDQLFKDNQLPDLKLYYKSMSLDPSSSSISSDVVVARESKCSTMPRIQPKKEWNRDSYWEENRIQPYFVIVSIPRIDRILSVKDVRRNKTLSTSQALTQGVADEHFLEILDTETDCKYSYQEAIDRGLISLVPVVNTDRLCRSSSYYGDNFSKIVYKIDRVFDPNKEEWINLREAVASNIVNCFSGQVRLNSSDFCHIIKAIEKENVCGKRIFNCNIKSLPPEITIEIPKFL